MRPLHRGQQIDVGSVVAISCIEMQTLDVRQAVAMIELVRGGAIFIPVLLGVLCGLRRGEICALRWRNIDLDSGRLSVVASMEEVRGGVVAKERQGAHRCPATAAGRRVAPPSPTTSRMAPAAWCPADRRPSHLYARGSRYGLARLHWSRLPDF